MNPFYRLATFIQEYIYRQGWEELRPIQIEAIQKILDTNHHILITSGTASGKTEAAMLPILTQLDAQPASSIGILYIGPLKALINDQFERLQGLLEESGIPVQSWHGDIAQSRKTRFLRQAQGILQITPESLEAMLINRHTELARLFGDLRFVVIDELHAFIGSDRGRQILCQLQRLARFQSRPARRIGLSATLGEPESAMSWLAGGTGLPVALIDDKTARREVQLGLEHFLMPVDEHKDTGDQGAIEVNYPVDLAFSTTEPQADVAIDTMTDLLTDKSSLYRHLYQMSRSARKTLIFANTRADVEQAIANLRAFAAEANTPDIYHVHHGSIAAPLREAAEAAMRDAERPACIAATVTLELGIDMGQLDQVLQLDATNTVSSFVQRLGRSGRRGTPAKMFFYSREQEPNTKRGLGELIPWDLLQAIAAVQLYIEEKWVEPPDLPQLPFSLLYHQTMSALMAATELSPPQLAQRVLSLYPFSTVMQEHFRILLRHLLATKHLELTETGALIVGMEGEKIVNNYRFYATFEDEKGVRVLNNSREIGAIPELPEVDTSFRLAGFTWRVVSRDAEQKVVHVQHAQGKAKMAWGGNRGEIHTRILQRMRQVLREGTVYGYIHQRAQQRLDQARKVAQKTGLASQYILPRAPNRYMLLPWRGSRTIRTLETLLEYNGVDVVQSNCPFYLEVVTGATTVDQFQKQLYQLSTATLDPTVLVNKLTEYQLRRAKYDRFIPKVLLQEAYAKDSLDLEQAKVCLYEICGI